MNSRIVGLRIAGVIFGLFSLAQLARLLTGAEVLVAGHGLPMWPSAVAFIVGAGLSLWMLKLSRGGTS
jgi:hypothetical protein